MISLMARRIARRIAELQLDDLQDYRERLLEDAAEWQVLDGLCRVTISRFLRDRGVWQTLADPVLPALCAAARQRGATTLRCWSAGCANGEEPYTLSLILSLVSLKFGKIYHRNHSISLLTYLLSFPLPRRLKPPRSTSHRSISG